MRTKTLLLILLTGVILSSCQKENDLDRGNGVNEKIMGTWNFVGMKADLSTSITAGSGLDEETMLSNYSFTSTNNTGTITFDATKCTSTGLAYSYNTIVNFEMYSGGVLFDSFETPMIGDMPTSHGSTEYKTLGEDSLRFEKGFAVLEAPASQGGPVTHATTPANIGISWARDTLILTDHVIQIQNQIINGVNARVTNNVLQVVKLKK
jgi:hypothetical protein